MNYELALKLKEAGLQIEHTFIDCEPCHCGILIKRRQEFHIPTLEELIEACGDQLELIVKRSPLVNPFWEAYKVNGEGFCAEGPTPTEAVANLWLALNANK